jgi:uncharacterized protein (DUF305 family)
MRYAREITVAAVAAALLTGCGGAEPPSSGHEMHQSQPSGQHAPADVAFAQGMIPHHTQAVGMSTLAHDRAQSGEVKDLARQIESAQGPEIETMTGWLRNWGAPVPQPGMDHSGHGGTGHDMRGMMSPEDMRQLERSSGSEFDRLFLEMMIRHHEGAITMAQAELGAGQDAAAKQLAQQITGTQQAEIDRMKSLLPQS